MDNNGNLTTTFGSPQTVTDADGNVYKTVKIGNQIWMAENLNVGVMLNATVSTSTTVGQAQTDNMVTEKYCFDNDAANCTEYGGMYTATEALNYVYQTGTQGVCPDGWHIPTVQDWETLLALYPAEEAMVELHSKLDIKIGGMYGGISASFYYNVMPWMPDAKKLTVFWSSEITNINNDQCIGSYLTSEDHNSIQKEGGLASIYIERAFYIRCIKD